MPFHISQMSSFFLVLSHLGVESDVIILCGRNITHVFRTNTALEFGHEESHVIFFFPHAN